MIKCSECGYENMDGLDYCDGCGAKLAAAAGSSAAAPAAAPATETKTETPPEPTAESIDGKATPSLAADAKPDGETPTTEVPRSEAPTGEIKPETAPESAPSTAAAAGAPFKAKLSVVRGGRKGQEFPLEDGNNLVGRWDPETGSFPEVDLDASMH
jgi:hypothetical protein